MYPEQTATRSHTHSHAPQVGSISDNRLGGWYAYRGSKAALNQMTKTLALELSRRRAPTCVLALHPGTCDTDLSRPWHKVRSLMVGGRDTWHGAGVTCDMSGMCVTDQAC